MKFICRLSMGIVLGVVGVAQSQTKPVDLPVDFAQVATLVEQLGASSGDARDQAQAKLVSLGLPIRDALKQQLERADDPEVHDRLELILAELSQLEIRQPQRVTIELKDANAYDLANEIGTAFGLRSQQQFQKEQVARMPDFAQRLGDVTLRDVTWFEATDYLREKTKVSLQLYPQYDGAKMAFQISNDRSQRTHGVEVDAGLARLSVTSLNYSWSQTIARPGEPPIPPHKSLMLMMSVACEPRILSPETNPPQVVVTSVVDSNGNALLPPEGREFFHSSHGHNPIPMHVPLKFPVNPGERIRSVKGDIVIQIPTGYHQISISDIAPGKTFSASDGPLKVEISEVASANPNSTTIQYQVDLPPVDTNINLPNPHLNRIRQPLLELVDANNQPIRGNMSSTQQPSNSRFIVRLELDARQRRDDHEKPGIAFPLTATLRTPKGFTEVRVPFEFNDLPMRQTP
jgi:hypothetical protein